jgi:two-component system response regulator FlrC
MPKFLVVDDDAATVRGIAALLAVDGHEVVPFTAGADAVEALARDSFDAVVTDLDMPHVDGHEVVRTTRRHQPRACLVVATARAEEKAPELVNAGACIVADKPLEYDEFAKAVTDCRARGGPGAHGKCHMRMRPDADQVLPLGRR